MKKTRIILLIFTAILACSCSLFELDNMKAPSHTLKGSVVDRDGMPVLTDQGSEGIRVRITETSYGDNVQHNPDFYCRPDGTFQNTKLFEGDYNVRIDGPFIPIVRETEDGVVIADGSSNVHIKGTTKVDFQVDPFLKVELDGYPTISDGRVSVKVKVTRGVSRERFQELIEPMGGYENGFANVTDVQLFVSRSSSCGYRARDERWSSKVEYTGDSFDGQLGKSFQLRSAGTIPSGTKVFIRAAARINYDTPRGSGTRRYNYSEIMEIDIP